jgi:hypothetical protein
MDMDRRRLEDKIAAKINIRLATNRPSSEPWIVHELVTELMNDLQSDELRIVLYEGYRQIVGDVIRNLDRKNGGRKIDPALVLPGFERLQIAYSVVREGKGTIVPIHEMTQEEAYAKRAELAAMRNGLDTHIREWDRYIEARWPTPKKLGSA